MNINRQPAGQPTGGQFAESARAGANVALSTTGNPTEDYILALPKEDQDLARALVADVREWEMLSEETDVIGHVREMGISTDSNHSDGQYGLDVAVHAAQEQTDAECPDVKLSPKYFNGDGDYPEGWEAWYPLDKDNPNGPVVVDEILWENESAHHPEAEGFDALMVYARGARAARRQMQATYDRNRRPSLQEMAYLVEVDKMRRDETKIEWADKDGNMHQGTVRGGSWTADGQLDPGDGPGTHVRVTMNSGTERFIPFDDMAEKIAGHSLRSRCNNSDPHQPPTSRPAHRGTVRT